MKVFLDIGAHNGETLDIVLDPRWRFDRIVCFEPAPPCWPILERLADDRVEICKFGLWRTNEQIVLHNPGAIGASVAADKDRVQGSTLCDFRDAAAWFADNLDPTDEVYAKINVEGAEAELVRRLAEAGLLSQIEHLLIHFDVRKSPSLAHLEGEMRAQLDEAEVEYHVAEDIQFGIVTRGTVNWLRWCHGNPKTRDLLYKRGARLVFAARRALYPVKRRLAG